VKIRRIGAGPRMSKAVRYGDMVFLSGQVPDDSSADVAGQTRQVLAKIEAVLAEAGTDKSKILSAQIWLADIGTFEQMNAVWDAWVAPGDPPARATVEARLANSAFKVEIMVVAAR